MDDVRVLKDEAARAMGRGQWRSALKLYAELSKAEPKEGTWALRAGDAARRLGQHREAISWYERAAATYGECGFVVRAIAVGKMVQSLDPGNDRVLKALDTSAKRPAIDLPKKTPSKTPPERPEPIVAPKTKEQETAPLRAPGLSGESVSTTSKSVGDKAQPQPPRRAPKEVAGVEAAGVATNKAAAPAPAKTKVKPPPLPKDAATVGPPLKGRLTGPPLSRKPHMADEPSMQSMEIVFEDVDDGIPIEESSILLREDDITASQQERDEQLLSKLPAFPFFDLLPRGAFLSLVSRMEHRSFAKGDLLVQQGDIGTSLFAIVEGTASVYFEDRADVPLATLEPGQVFGEIALVLDQPRSATVQALSALEAFEMDRTVLGAVLDEFPELADVISRLIKRRLVQNVMNTAPLFEGLDAAARRELMLRFEVREVENGTKIVEQDTAADGLYMILAGRVRATRQEEGEEQEVADLGPGQIIGAFSFLDASRKSRNKFETTRDTIALRLPRVAFNEVVCCFPPVLEHLSQIADDQAHWEESDFVAVV